MKKFILKSVSLILAISLLSAQNFSIMASTTTAAVEFDESVFSYDDDLLLNELSELNELDAYIEANEGTTFDELTNENSPLVANIESTASPMGMADQNGEPPLGIPSFLWGCVFGLVGLLIVYVATDNNKVEAKKAALGCLAWGAAWTLTYMLVWGAWAAAVDATY